MLPVAFDSCLGLDLGPVAGLEVEQFEVGPHLEAVFVDHLEAVCEQQFEADFDSQFEAEYLADYQLEADFDTARQHLETERSEVAFERHCLDFELQLEAVFVRQFLEAG